MPEHPRTRPHLRSRHRLHRRGPQHATAWVLVLVLAATVTACSTNDGAPSTKAAVAAAATPDESAVAAAKRFLGTYIGGDGRVVRADQHGDTVSEGQGYAMLLAVAVHDGDTFRRVWAWTKQALQEPSGLFAYHWGGGVTDKTPATDADLQIAWALDLGAQAFGDSSWRDEAGRIARAIAASEIGYDDQGAPVLAAGPWAVQHGQPTTVEPGYWTPPASAALATLTGDQRLAGLGTSTPTHLAALTRQGKALPPDWATIGGGDAGTSIAAPDHSAPVQFGPDAMRTLVWASCSAGTRSTVAGWWPLLAATADSAPLSRSLGGAPLNSDKAPLSAVAAAAAAQAAGNETEALHLLDVAEQIDHDYPTYYGSAWVALGRVLLTTQRLAACAS